MRPNAWLRSSARAAPEALPGAGSSLAAVRCTASRRLSASVPLECHRGRLVGVARHEAPHRHAACLARLRRNAASDRKRASRAAARRTEGQSRAAAGGSRLRLLRQRLQQLREASLQVRRRARVVRRRHVAHARARLRQVPVHLGLVPLQQRRHDGAVRVRRALRGALAASEHAKAATKNGKEARMRARQLRSAGAHLRARVPEPRDEHHLRLVVQRQPAAGVARVSAAQRRGASGVCAPGARQNTVWSPTLSSTVKMASTSLRCARERVSPSRAAAGRARAAGLVAGALRVARRTNTRTTRARRRACAAPAP